jgi:HEAT repeat protein
MTERITERLARAGVVLEDSAHEARWLSKHRLETLQDLEALIDTNPGPADMVMAAWFLGRVGDGTDSVRRLEELLLQSADSRVRVEAAMGLGLLGGARAQRGLQRAVQRDPDESVRARAAHALGLIPEHSTTALMAALAGDGSPAVRAAAAEALARPGNGEAVSQMLAALADSAAEVRLFSAYALGVIGDPTAIESLRLLLDDREEVESYGSVASEAQEAIDALSNP